MGEKKVTYKDTSEVKTSVIEKNDEAPSPPDLKSMLEQVALKPGEIPNLQYEEERATIKACSSPPKHSYWQAHQTHEKAFCMIQSGKEMETKMHIIGPGVKIPPFLSDSISYITCHPIIFPDGSMRILERKTAPPGEIPNDYQLSSLRVIEAAREDWVMRKWSKEEGVFQFRKADAGYAPQPQWPEIDFMDLLSKAYEGRIIDSEDHPVFKELMGKKALIDD